MRRTTRFAAAIASAMLAAMTAGCANSGDNEGARAASTGKRSCFWPNNVSGFSSLDRDSVIVHVGVRERYQLDTFGTCPNLDFNWRLGLRTRPPGGMVCDGADIDLIIPDGLAGVDRCPVRMIKRLPDEKRGG